MQILYERGWIDPHNIQHYTEKGKKNVSEDPTFPVDPTGCNFSIDKLMKQQIDFVNELTLLQYHGNLLGVTVDRSPKCHPEIAGEGIEYLWGLSKMWYRKAPISSKRTKDLFRKLVNDATDGSSVMNIERVRSCSKKARAYMKLYKAFRDMSEEDFESIPNKYSIMEGAIKKYSRLTKLSKTHRSVLDINMDDITDIERSTPLHVNKTVQSNENTHIKAKVMIKLLNKMVSM